MEKENGEEKYTSVTPCTSMVRRNLLSRFENSEDSGIFSITPGSREHSYKSNDYSFNAGRGHHSMTPSSDDQAVQLTPDVISGSINFYPYPEHNAEQNRDISKDDHDEMMDLCCAPIADNVSEREDIKVLDQVHEKSVYMDCEDESFYHDAQSDLPSAATSDETVSVSTGTICASAAIVTQQRESSSSNGSPQHSPASSRRITPRKYKSPKRRKQSKSKLLFKQKYLTGFEYIDILYFLGQKENFTHIVTKILSYLSVEDLLNVCAVSKTWQKVCNDDLQARKRLKNYKEICWASKENRYKGSKEERKKNGSRPFSNIQNICEGSPVRISSPAVSPRTKRFQLFRKEGEKLDTEGKLIMCPECEGPVRCNSSGNNLGLCDRCRYKFCTNCRYKYHYPKRCVRITSLPSIYQPFRVKKDMIIGSKESKRRLSRT